MMQLRSIVLLCFVQANFKGSDTIVDPNHYVVILLGNLRWFGFHQLLLLGLFD